MVIVKLLVKGELTRALGSHSKTCPRGTCQSVCVISMEQFSSAAEFVCPKCGAQVVFEESDAIGQIFSEADDLSIFPKSIPFGVDEELFGSVQYSLGLSHTKIESVGGGSEAGNCRERNKKIVNPWVLARKYSNSSDGWTFGKGDNFGVCEVVEAT